MAGWKPAPLHRDYVLWCSLSVTGRAALQRFDAHMFNQFFAFDRLQMRGFNAVRAPRPTQIRDFVRRADVRRRVTMAVEAKTHAQGFVMAHFVHLVNAAMALHATDAARDMDGMVEINVVGRLVNLHPRNWRVVRRAVADDCEARVVLQNLAVTIHASRSAGKV